MFAVEIKEGHELYNCIGRGELAKKHMRDRISQLGIVLAKHTRTEIAQRIVPSNEILCVVILRGGMMLYPGFLSEFPDADFCMIGMQRQDNGEGVLCNYATTVRRKRYDVALYIDCIAASGRTILTTRALLKDRCIITRDAAALLSCSATGAQVLQQEGVGLVGISLNESLKGDVVSPDFGELDAGDLFTSAR